MVDLAEIGIILQTISVMSAATAAVIGVRSYINSNKRAEEAKKKEQETQELALKAQQQNLETRQAQLFMNIYDKSTTKEFNQAWNKFVYAPFNNWIEFNKLLGEPEFMDAYRLLDSFYEGVGVLVREGLLPIRMVALLICGATHVYCKKMMLYLEEARRTTGHRRWSSETEYLYVELLKYLKEHPELDTNPELDTLAEVHPRELS